MGCPKITYSLYSKPALRCVYNAADVQESHVFERKDNPFHLANLKTVNGSAVIRDMDFVFNPATGNLDSRTGMISQTESFLYDNLDRLTTVKHNNANNTVLSYAPSGNILNKTGLGAYEYHPTKAHAVEYIENTDGLLNTRVQ